MLADALFGKNDLHSWCVYGCNWDVRTIKAVICIICLRFEKQPPVETCFRNRSLFTFSVDFLHRHGAVRRDPLWCHRLYRLVDVEVFGAEDRRQVRPVRTEQKQAGASDCWDLSSKLGCDNWTCVSKLRKFWQTHFWIPSQGFSFHHKVACLIVYWILWMIFEMWHFLHERHWNAVHIVLQKNEPCHQTLLELKLECTSPKMIIFGHWCKIHL